MPSNLHLLTAIGWSLLYSIWQMGALDFAGGTVVHVHEDGVIRFGRRGRRAKERLEVPFAGVADRRARDRIGTRGRRAVQGVLVPDRFAAVGREIPEGELGRLFHVRQQVNAGADVELVGTHRQHAVGRFVVVGRETPLFDVVAATHPGGRFADLLDGGEQQADQNGDDRDHHQEFDQREPTPITEARNHLRLLWGRPPSSEE